MRNENLPLINDVGVAAVQTGKKSNPVVIKIVSFGIGSVLIAVNLTENSILLRSLGHPGAGSLTTSFQSLFLGICGGALMSTGVALGKSIGEKDFVKASEIAKTAYVFTGALTAISTLGYGATYFVFPKLFSEETAKAASTYFLISGIGNWPALALVSTGQIAFQCGDWKSPLVSTIAYRIPSAILSYILANSAKLGVEGVGIGNAIAPWASYIAMQFWLMRNEFQHLAQASFSKDVINKHFKALSVLGAKMSFQRITEWGNLAIITALLGVMSNENLVSINPSLQIMTFFNLFSQGLGLGGNMLTSVLRSKMNTLIKNNNADSFDEMRQAQKNTVSIVIKSLVAGLAVNSALALGLFFAKKPIADLFVSDAASAEMHNIAETALWINGLSLVADAVRIISGNLLNTWDKILFPNVISLFFMTIVGIPAGYLASIKNENNDVVTMFAVRTAMIFVAAVINAVVLYQSIISDKRNVDAVIENRPIEIVSDQERNCLTFWCATFARKRCEESDHVQIQHENTYTKA